MADSHEREVTHELGGNQRRQATRRGPSRRSGFGRYRVEKILGSGGFGRVYLAHDQQLDRPVAVKVPDANLISHPKDAEAYLTEARVVANLDHPTIVPVHDVGRVFGCHPMEVR
jgi:serine/threonine protein kinase